MPPATLAAVSGHGTLTRTVDRNLPGARDVLSRLGGLWIDLDQGNAASAAEGVRSFVQAFGELSDGLAARATALIARQVGA